MNVIEIEGLRAIAVDHLLIKLLIVKVRFPITNLF